MRQIRGRSATVVINIPFWKEGHDPLRTLWTTRCVSSVSERRLTNWSVQVDGGLIWKPVIICTVQRFTDQVLDNHVGGRIDTRNERAVAVLEAQGGRLVYEFVRFSQHRRFVDLELIFELDDSCVSRKLCDSLGAMCLMFCIDLQGTDIWFGFEICNVSGTGSRFLCPLCRSTSQTNVPLAKMFVPKLLLMLLQLK